MNSAQNEFFVMKLYRSLLNMVENIKGLTIVLRSQILAQ